MIGLAGRLFRETAIWGGASALAMALHLGGALWIMDRPGTAAPPGLPQPVLVDLVPAAAVSAAPPAGAAGDDPAPVASPKLPPLRLLEPPRDLTGPLAPARTLAASARPQARPERARVADRARQTPTPAQTRTPRQAAADRQKQPSPPEQAARRAEQGAGGSGSRGPDRAEADLMSQWGGRIRSCISRRALAPRGLDRGGRVELTLSVSRAGVIQSVGVRRSSGNAALDEAAVRAARQAGRCPPAPAGLTRASYSFQLPIAVQLR